MIGINLADEMPALIKVNEEFASKPMGSFDPMVVIGEEVQSYIAARYTDGGPLPGFSNVVSGLPVGAFSQLSFDQLCKVYFSSDVMLDRSVCALFESESKDHMLFHKITSSMWRWGHQRAKWNDVVDARECIRAFSIPLDGFEVRLDYTTHYNECGLAEYSRTFLDGVFAYLVYYRGEHVMTIGFSITAERRILIQQIQLAKRRGNRFLFRMGNRVEYVIGRFFEAFPNHDLYVVDGASIAGKSLASYRHGLEREIMYLGRELSAEDRAYHMAHHDAYMDKIAHLIQEVDRLRAFYDNVGRYTLHESARINALTHYLIRR